jgi:hypothetical protein
MATELQIRQALADALESGHLTVYPDREAWLNDRNSDAKADDGGPIYGASDIPKILGLCPPDWGTPFDVWAAHHRPELVKPRKQNEAMAAGLAWEEVAIRDWLAKTPGAELLFPPGTITRIGYPGDWLRVSPDALAVVPDPGGKLEADGSPSYCLVVIECKIPVNASDIFRLYVPEEVQSPIECPEYGWEYGSETAFGPIAPPMYQAQCQALFLAALKIRGTFTVLVDLWAWAGPHQSRRVRFCGVKEVEVDGLAKSTTTLAEEWRERHIINGSPARFEGSIPPEGAYRLAIADHLASKAAGTKVATPGQSALITQWVRAKAVEKAAKEQADQLKASVAAMMSALGAAKVVDGKKSAQITSNGQLRSYGTIDPVTAQDLETAAAQLAVKAKPRTVTWADWRLGQSVAPMSAEDLAQPDASPQVATPVEPLPDIDWDAIEGDGLEGDDPGF